MNGKIKEAFGQIQAEEALKDKTREFLAQKTQKYTKPIKRSFRVTVAACACFLFLLIGGGWLYFAPTSIISIDINPSFELGVNRFDRIVSINSLNSDAQELMNVIDIKFKNYADAMQQILENKQIAALLSNDEILTITVAGSDEAQSAKIFSEIELCTEGQRNTHCYFSSSAEVSSAHEAGLSCGKYRAFLELQVLDPDITPEAIQGMTMREIQILIDSLSNKGTNETTPDNDREGTHHGACKGHGHGGNH